MVLWCKTDAVIVAMMVLTIEWKYVICVCCERCSDEEFAQAESEQHLPVGFDIRRTEG